MDVKEMIEKGAEWLLKNDRQHYLKWEHALHDTREKYRADSIDFLLALGIIQKCPECGGTGKSKVMVRTPKFADADSRLPSIRSCPHCHQGYMATEDRLVEAVREIKEKAHELKRYPHSAGYGQSLIIRIADQALAEHEKESE